MRSTKKGVFIAVIVVLVVLLLTPFNWYKSSSRAVSDESSQVEFEVSEGATLGQVATELESAGIIRSAAAVKVYNKLKGGIILQAGIYMLDKSWNMPTIIDNISVGNAMDLSVSLTFIEGTGIEDYADVIAANTSNSREEVLAVMSDAEYMRSLIDKYWFLTDDILDEDIYYPLEGYLMPNTYKVANENVDVKTIVEMLLDQTATVLEPYKETIESGSAGYTIHEIMTLASITEREGKSSEDRAEIIGVFKNRLAAGMSLGSDVTTYYAFGVDMATSDLTYNQLHTANPYNTRGPGMEGKLPAGPICNPSEDAIGAVINYKTTDAMYFVADVNGKVYFTKTPAEHEAKIAELKAAGLWHIYE
ncbi:MAG: endolytic transglycosylase MltG [Lachnospiraceae bacterium]|nr:endolytic transglycosylase MltG [Lachnospiraceae bacterium]